MEFLESIAQLVKQFHDLLLVVLGGLFTLFGSLWVQDRRARNELRLKIQSGTADRLLEVENLVALIFNKLGRQSLLPLMTLLGGSTGPPPPEVRRLHASVATLQLRVHSFRRYPLLTDSLHYLVAATEELLSALTMASLGLPSLADPEENEDERLKRLGELQGRVSLYTITTNHLIDRIIAADLRSDLTVSMRLGKWVRRLSHLSRR